MPEEPVHQLLTITDVARLLLVSERTVYRLVGSGQLPGFKPGGGAWRFRKSDVDRWMDEQVASTRTRTRSGSDHE